MSKLDHVVLSKADVLIQRLHIRMRCDLLIKSCGENTTFNLICASFLMSHVTRCALNESM